MKVGYVALVGSPNVGKSTLLNRLVGQKLSIVSTRPQTTRHRILGIKTTPRAQLVFIDTPGLHAGIRRGINQALNRAAESALSHADAVVWLIDGPRWKPSDEPVRKRLADVSAPILLAINKIDRVTDKTSLLPFLGSANEGQDFHEIIPISAAKGTNVEALEQCLIALMPDGEAIYPGDQVTDRPMRFFASELIREKLLYRVGQEVPHALTVDIESYTETPTLVTIHATIWVERPGQKAIVIGRQGDVLKAVGTAARRELEAMVGKKVNLQLWAKVKEGWSDSASALRRFGYSD
ncbi:MAG: GTPase Era [Gammaproteobacteria bacterium]|nr:GTPase Era [Gammaproteobacteria bacterium]